MPLPAGLVAALLAAAPAGAVPADRIRSAAGAILGSRELQTSLPGPFHPTHLPLPAWLVRVLLWGGIAVVATLVAGWARGALRGLRRAPDAEEPEAAGAPPPIEIPSAEAAAAEGRFADAIHLLLLETLAALSRASRLAPSLTSREILARVSLGERAREALGGLVFAVELSRFGGAVPGEDDYRACLARFRAFSASYGSGA